MTYGVSGHDASCPYKNPLMWRQFHEIIKEAQTNVLEIEPHE
jgi:hypothetical protein